MILKFFSRKPPPPPPRDVADLLNGRTAPGVILAPASEGRSYLGGSVVLPPNIRWPSKDGKPLTFLACIDLSELKAAHDFEWLPPDGQLLFFYDSQDQPWGFDPKDRGGWSVLFLNKLAGSGIEQPVPALPRKSVRFIKVDTIPSWERLDDLGLTDSEMDLLIDLQDKQYQGHSQHQIGGFPYPIQGDGMELEAQLASSGVYCGDPEGYKNPRVKELRPGEKDWRLLLQFDSDDDIKAMWGDAGRLYFWVREHDARIGEFGNVWVVLQCY